IDNAGETIDRTVALADESKTHKSKAHASYVAAVRDAIEQRRQRGHGPFDAGELAPLAPLVPVLEKLDKPVAVALRTDLDRGTKLLSDGGKFHDNGGPELSLIPARNDVGDKIDYAYALGTTDVTRAAYDRFAKATGRPPTHCRESQSIFARSHDLTWESPGF